MNPEQIDRRLSQLSRIARPAAPDLRREVHAEISRRRSRSLPLRRPWALFEWDRLLLHPGVAAAALALALVIGSLPGALSLGRTHPETEVVQARRSLHLDVFSPLELLPTNPRNTTR